MEGAGSREASGESEGCDAATRRNEQDAHVAQSAERVLGKDEVISSILIVGSNPTWGMTEGDR